ncbi:MAG: peptide MFS transporter [Alistipes sp.]|nr:peptide MFS transporter [Alistipes sp.]
MFKGHPKGLYALALANTGERFGYYTMLAVFALFLRENFGLEAGVAGAIYSTFLGLVYFMPLVGGMMADKFGFGRMVTLGISVMFGGYLLLSVPLGGETVAMIAMMAALVLISVGTGLFKGNLQVMVGNLYDDPKYASKRDSGFSLFYMAINVGSLFAPTTAVGIKHWAETSLGYSSNDAYHFSFMVACAALILSILIYYVFRSTFRHVEGGKKKGEAAVVEDNLTPEQTKQRIVALCLVFAVVIFFWMAFHQNGLTLTYFADEFTRTQAFGFDTMLFNVWNLALIIIAVYATFSIFQSEGAKAKIFSGVLASAILAFLVYRAMGIEATAEITVAAPIFQQFNPFYVVALTPVSMAIFGSLARKGKEPSAPRKIAYGMLVAAIGFVIMAVGSDGLNTPNEQQRAIAVEKAETFAQEYHAVAATAEDFETLKADAAVVATIKPATDFMGKLNKNTKPIFFDVYNASVAIINAETSAVDGESDASVAEAEATLAAIKADTKPETRTSPYWLIVTYLILTFAELLLSPMGISFVSKVAPPKLKGLMMGGWFVATAIGNMLVAVGGFLWAGIPLWSVWTVFIVLCLLSALFMFVMMKRLESVTK